MRIRITTYTARWTNRIEASLEDQREHNNDPSSPDASGGQHPAEHAKPGVALTSSVRAQWISDTSNRSAAELLEQCKRLCEVGVCDARQALAVVASLRPDFIVFEFDNPVAEQLRLLQTVKQRHPGIPILLITATHNEELAIWALRARVWNYLVKPVPLRELKSNVDQLAKISLRRE